MRSWLTILIVLGVAIVPAFATVDLTLYNSFALVDNNGTTPLEGIASLGDLVQLILVGPNGVIDPPTTGTGAPSVDDTVLFTTHVGAGLPTTNTGFLVQSGILYADSFGGNSNAYVRFWNSNTTANATFFGNSALFTLPSGDAFGLAEFDFVPLSGSPRTANQEFSGGGPAAVPEPSQLFLFGLIIMGGWLYRKRGKSKATAAIAVALGLLAASHDASAQIPSPVDVTASSPILNFDGAPLAGKNPVSGDTNNCLVQIIRVGANGVADLPNLDGTPGGDDTIAFTTVIGQGINPSVEVSGQFSTSFYPPPLEGSEVYARVFNAPTVAAATHWGQSATFTVQNVDVFDLSALGLQRTAMPKGVDLNAVDAKGLTYYQELIANTNPNDPGDFFAVKQVGSDNGSVPVNQVSVNGRAGRQYILERALDLGAANWSGIVTSAVLNADANLTLSDPSPPNTPKAFYRLKVTMP